jgi:hypothetical protein
MKPCKADRVRMVVCLLFLLAAVPAFCQRGTFDLNVGQVSDQFGAIPAVTSPLLDLNGEVTVIKPDPKKGGASIVAGGEVRVPTDGDNHAKELALYGGVAFAVRHDLSIGADAEFRKIYMPIATLDGQTFVRDNLKLFQLPLVIKYKFGPGKHAFIEARGEPEFTPHYKLNKLATPGVPKPNFDHGYTVGGSVGYTFSKYLFVKGTYQTRYFKFLDNPGNPTSLYNWKSNVITGGVGISF